VENAVVCHDRVVDRDPALVRVPVMPRHHAHARTFLLWAALIGSAFLFYFGVMLYSECGLPDRSWANLEKKRIIQGFILVVAVILICIHPNDVRARVGALFLAVAGTAPAFPHEDMRQIWRDLPMLLGVALWIPQIAHFMALPLFFTFHAILPRPLFAKKWQWILIWTPAVVLSAWAIAGLFSRVYQTSEPKDVPKWYLFVVGVSVLVYGFGGLAALLRNYYLLEQTERRHLTVLTFGTIAGWSPGFLFLSAIFLAPFTESPLVWSLVVPPFKHIALAMFAIVPVSLLYGVLVDKALSVR
jgi:hypothetical protein